MKKVIYFILLVGLCFFNTGCASYMVYKGSQRQVGLRKAILSGNERAIRAINLGENAVGLGIDISNWEVLSERPFYQLGAAILDLGVTYGATVLADELSSSGSSDKSNDINVNAGGDSNLIIGNGNNITNTKTSPQVVPTSTE
jgi:hypothetical protein